MQRIMDRVVQHSESHGLSLNISKTKAMVFSKRHVPITLKVKGVDIEQVANFKYLGTNLNEDCDIRKEIRGRIEQARTAFMSMRSLFISTELSLELRLRMIRYYIFPVLLYGCESWTLDSAMENRLQAFEMWLYRRMLRVSWIQKVTNEEILRRVNKNTELLPMIKRRKLLYLGHILRGERYGILRLVMEGKICGARSAGRRRNSWLRDLRRWLGCSSIELFRKAVSRIQIAIWMANLL